MRGINQVQMSGALVKDGELKYTASGLAILRLEIGGIEHVNGRELSFYHRMSVFGRYAEAIVEQMVQGAIVFITGRLNFSSYESNGQKRSAVDIVVDRLVTLEGGDLSDDNRGQPRLVGAINSVTLGGNLTRDAELKSTDSGHGVARLGIAVNETYRDNAGKDQERVGYYNVEAWDDLAAAVGGLPKSTPVVATGRLKNSSWEKDGVKQYATELSAASVMVAATGDRPATKAPQQELAATTTATENRGSRRNPPTRQQIEAEFPDEESLPF